MSTTNFMGPARQMGSGGGLGAFAVRMGRVAVPIVKKYVLPVAKQVEKTCWKQPFRNLVKLL